MALALYALVLRYTIHGTASTSHSVLHMFLFLTLPRLYRDAGFCQVFRRERLRKLAPNSVR